MPINISYFRSEKGDVNALLESQKRRFADPAIHEEAIATDASWREAETTLNKIKKEINDYSDKIGKIKRAQREGTAADVDGQTPDQQVAALVAKQEEIKTKQKALEETRKNLAAKFTLLTRRIGNIVDDSVPISKDERENLVVKSVGTTERVPIPGPVKKLQHHDELLELIDGYVPEQGAVVAGHRGYYLKGVGCMLNQALIAYGQSFLRKRQYTQIQPPYFMKKEIMAETAQLEEFDEALYHVVEKSADGKESSKDEDYYLIATSEQPISALHRGEWLNPKDLPIRYAGISTCFRKEAGSHGRDVWGVFRVHQFEKVEQFCLTAPDKSKEMHEEMIKTCEEFYDSLGLSYRVINIVSGALNNAAAKKLDLEAWFPTLGVYRELVSASNCTDYQARAMETRFGQATKGAEKTYVHMLNATLCATERTMCCILENYQTDEGIVVPEVLRPYMDGMELLKFVKKEVANPHKDRGTPAAPKA